MSIVFWLKSKFKMDTRTPYQRGFDFAKSEFEREPTQEKYDELMVLQDDQVNRTDFDRGMKAFLRDVEGF